MLRRSISQEILHIEVKRFGDVDIDQPFFDSFRKGYAPYYEEWIEKKKDDNVIIVEDSDGIIGFLKMKFENEEEDYSDITPLLTPARRLKVSSLKVSKSNLNIGSWFMSSVLMQAKDFKVTEVYATLLSECEYKEKLVKYLTGWGFQFHGKKHSHGLEEDVYVKKMKS